MKYLMRKWTVSLLIILIVLTFSSVSAVPVAKAGGIPTFDALGLVESILIYIEEVLNYVEQYAATAQQYYEWDESFDLSALKNTLVDQVSDKIVSYVQEGSDGKPRFVTNWTEYLNDARDNTNFDITKNISSSDLCDTFGNSLRSAIGSTGGSGGSAINKLDCDFSKTQLDGFKDDPTTITKNDYSKILEPQNNYYGALLLSHDIQQRAIDEAEKAATNEAISGGGFLGARSDGEITTPGSILKDLTSKAATSKFDLIINAEQLKDVVGSIGSSLISELTSGGSNSGGITRSNVARRRAARNNTRNSSGDPISLAQSQPDCAEVFTGTLNDTQIIALDINPTDGILDSDEIENAIRNDNSGEFESALYDLCLSNATAQVGNLVSRTNASVDSILVKRRESRKPLQDLVTTFSKTPRVVNDYMANTKWHKGTNKYRIDNPFYDSSVSRSGLTWPSDKDEYIKTFKAIYIKSAYTKDPANPSTPGTASNGVNYRECFNLHSSSATFSASDIGRDRNGANKPYFLYASVDYINEDDLAKLYGIDDSDPDRITKAQIFVAGVTPNTNPAYGFKTNRCTVAVTTASGAYIEAEFFQALINKTVDVKEANELAFNKIKTLKDMLELATKIKSTSKRNEKVQNLITDFECHGSPFSCAVPSPTDKITRNYPEQDVAAELFGQDADPYFNQAGYYDPPAYHDALGNFVTNGTFIAVPQHKAMSPDDLFGGRDDTYTTILRKLGLNPTATDCYSSPNSSDANCVAQRGLITNINPDNKEDDPSNPFFDPAFNIEEAQRVFEFSQGSYEILGNLLQADEVEEGDANADTDAGGDNNP